jgi:hypothetical protein
MLLVRVGPFLALRLVLCTALGADPAPPVYPAPPPQTAVQRQLVARWAAKNGAPRPLQVFSSRSATRSVLEVLPLLYSALLTSHQIRHYIRRVYFCQRQCGRTLGGVRRAVRRGHGRPARAARPPGPAGAAAPRAAGQPWGAVQSATHSSSNSIENILGRLVECW